MPVANAAPRDLSTRTVTTADAEAVAGLSEELGYAVSTEVMRQRIESLARLTNHMVYVACVSREVVGWIDVAETRHLAVEPRAEINGLVVTSEARGRGIGRCLVACAERWALERGLKHMVVRSRVTREEAHRFYLREGYERTKTSAVFAKQLGYPERANE